MGVSGRAVAATMNPKFSDKNSNVDWKLIAYVLYNIIHDTLHEK